MNQTAPKVRNLLVIALVLVIVLDGVGWGVAVLPGLNYAMTHGELQPVHVAFGFAPNLQSNPEIRGLSGPFEQLGIGALVVAGLIFVVISWLKVLAAYWVWNLRRDGVVLASILLGLSVIFWYGFSLPLPPVFGLAQVILMAFAWRRLS